MSFVIYHDEPETVSENTSTACRYSRYFKRVFDVILVIALLPVALPIVAISVVLTRLDGRAGLFTQSRVGRDGAIFRCWKIRTMVPDAERVLDALLRSDPAIAREWQMTQKLRNDPRITRVGGFLRRTSIDELPQLWNILKGDMSFVGPRPFTPIQKAMYDAVVRNPAYYEMRPGISGLWQTESRDKGQFRDRVHFDQAYAANLSFGADMRIALKTLQVLSRADGN